VPQHSNARQLRAAGDDRGDSRILAAVRPQDQWTNKPSRSNQALFDTVVEEVAAAAERLIRGWVTTVPPRDRDVEIRKHIERSRLRFGKEAPPGRIARVKARSAENRS
jgi:hypothetical protein